MSKQKMTNKELVDNYLPRLMGQVLTIIEAVLPAAPEDLLVGTFSTSSSQVVSQRQNTQREATKQLIRSAFGYIQDELKNNIV